MNKDQFLPSDAKLAITEYRASWTNISKVEDRLMRGDLKEAKLAAANLLTSINELEKLQKSKTEVDEMVRNLEALLRSKNAEMMVIFHES